MLLDCRAKARPTGDIKSRHKAAATEVFYSLVGRRLRRQEC